MSTRGLIARVGKAEGECAGRYTHSDSMPMSRGPLLFQILREEFNGDLKKMLAYLIDKHPAGWSSLIPEHRSCYCHPKTSSCEDFKRRKPEPAQLVTHIDLKDSDIEWAYIFDGERNRMSVRDLRHDSESIVELAEPEPNKDGWRIIECGEEYERCSHRAWFHNLVPRTCNLSTKTWLGQQPLDFHDVVAFIIAGKRYSATGSGGHSSFYSTPLARQHGFTGNYPPNSWVASVKARNGKRIDVPVAKIVGRDYEPLPGVVWIYPPTAVNPSKTMVSL